MYDVEAIKKQIKQHQDVIDTLQKQKLGLDANIDQMNKEIAKLDEVLKLMDSVED